MPERGDPARPPAEERSWTHHDPRLQAQRHDHALCRAQRAGWLGHWPEHAAPPAARQWFACKPREGASGVHPLPQPDRTGRPGRQIRPRHPPFRRMRAFTCRARDNYCTHKHSKVRAWLARHPRWTFHFISTSSSWLNAPSRACKHALPGNGGRVLRQTEAA